MKKQWIVQDGDWDDPQNYEPPGVPAEDDDVHFQADKGETVMVRLAASGRRLCGNIVGRGAGTVSFDANASWRIIPYAFDFDVG